MKFKKNMKKGFTLVELIVVIAIVAILAAVSVVSYLAFINKGNESADVQLVKQLNTCLQADEALHGKKDWSQDYKGLTSLLESNGFIIENLTKTKSGCDMVYQGKIDDDHIINRYALLNGDKVIYSETTFVESNNCRNLWIPDTAKEAQDLSDKGKGVVLGSEIGEVNVFEAHGSVIVNGAKVHEIQYSNDDSGQTVTIDTDGGSLKIDAQNDTVNHYGKVDYVDIKAVDSNNSYHEFGTISQKVQIAQGRLVVESTGNIPLVEVTAVPTEEAPVKIETSKDIVVTVSDEVADSLGENKLPNTEIKVSNTEANVTVDAAVEASSVEINGTPATTEDLELVYKATTVAEIESAPAGSYVMLMNDLGPEDMPYEYMDFGGWGFNNPRYIKLKDITLDLNGFTIESGRITAVDVSGTVEILDSSLDKNGQIIHTGKGSVEDGKIFNVNNYATLIISGGTFTSTQGDGIYVDRRLNSNIIINGGIISAQVYGIVLTPQNGVAYLTINGGTITSQTDYAITGNGLNDGTVININDGEINGHKTAIYHPQDGVLNITGGTISGESAVEMRAGTLTVSGNAVLRGNGSYSCQANGNGHTTTGSALAIAQHTTLKDINVTINGGKFEGAKAVAINNPHNNETNNVTVTINGGTFSGEIYKNPDNASAWTLTDNR